MSTSRVSVVIPAKDAEHTIADQLEALARQDTDDYEVVVVLNQCRDRTGEVVLEWAGRVPGLRVVHADAVASASYARNVGAGASAGSKLLFCDADDAVAPNWVSCMSSRLDDAALCQSKLLPLGHSPRWMLAASVVGRHGGGLPTVGYLRYALGASLGIRRDVFMSAEGWDERFRRSSDDIALSIRVLRLGHAISLVDETWVRYRLRPTVRRFLRQQWSYGQDHQAWTMAYSPWAVRSPRRELARAGTKTAEELRRVRSRVDLGIAVAAATFRFAYCWSVIEHRRRPSAPEPQHVMRNRVEFSYALRLPGVGGRLGVGTVSQAVLWSGEARGDGLPALIETTPCDHIVACGDLGAATSIPFALATGGTANLTVLTNSQDDDALVRAAIGRHHLRGLVRSWTPSAKELLATVRDRSTHGAVVVVVDLNNVDIPTWALLRAVERNHGVQVVVVAPASDARVGRLRRWRRWALSRSAICDACRQRPDGIVVVRPEAGAEMFVASRCTHTDRDRVA